MSFTDHILDLDKQLFSRINGDWHNHFLDKICPLLREAGFWAPLYFFLLLFALINYRRHGWSWSLFLILTAVISDIVSSRIIKENFFRLRPCNDAALAENLRLLVKYCPQSSSFTSSHAVTHFAMAMFIYYTYRRLLGRWWPLIFIWAGSVCYAQVYVGVHYPLDVACGAIVGLIIGYLLGKFFTRKVGTEMR